MPPKISQRPVGTHTTNTAPRQCNGPPASKKRTAPTPNTTASQQPAVKRQKSTPQKPVIQHDSASPPVSAGFDQVFEDKIQSCLDGVKKDMYTKDEVKKTLDDYKKDVLANVQKMLAEQETRNQEIQEEKDTEFKARLTKAQELLQAKLAIVQSDLRSSESAHERARAEYESRIVALERARTEDKAANATLQTEVKSLETKLASLQKNIPDVVWGIYNQCFGDVPGEIDAMNDKLETLQKTTSELRKDNDINIPRKIEASRLDSKDDIRLLKNDTEQRFVNTTIHMDSRFDTVLAYINEEIRHVNIAHAKKLDALDQRIERMESSQTTFQENYRVPPKLLENLKECQTTLINVKTDVSSLRETTAKRTTAIEKNVQTVTTKFNKVETDIGSLREDTARKMTDIKAHVLTLEEQVSTAQNRIEQLSETQQTLHTWLAHLSKSLENNTRSFNTTTESLWVQQSRKLWDLEARLKRWVSDGFTNLQTKLTEALVEPSTATVTRQATFPERAERDFFQKLWAKTFSNLPAVPANQHQVLQIPGSYPQAQQPGIPQQTTRPAQATPVPHMNQGLQNGQVYHTAGVPQPTMRPAPVPHRSQNGKGHHVAGGGPIQRPVG